MTTQSLTWQHCTNGHNPAFGQDLEARHIGSLHDLQPPCPSAQRDERHLRACISAISKDTFDEGKQSSRPAQQLEGTVAILNISRMDDDVQQEAQRVDQDVPLATFDFLARVVARRIEPSPPFRAPFALCESMIAAVGLASRPSSSRTAT
jgi:hypothetical protein